MTKIVTVVGVGALGSHLVQFLRNEDVEIRVIDFDRIERRNTQSQFHGTPSVGRKKVDGLRQSMQFLFGRRIEAVPHKLVADNIDTILQGDLVVDCLDNAESRALIQSWVRASRIPCLHGALAADGSFGRAIWDEAFVVDSEDEPGAVTCENGEFLPFIALTAAYLARAVQTFLSSEVKEGYSISPAGAVRV